MKLRHLKGLLKAYPPIVVIYLPERINMAEMIDLGNELKSKFPKFKFLILRVPVGNLIIESELTDEQIEDFKKQFLQLRDYSHQMFIDDTKPTFQECKGSPVEIISPLKIPVKLYKEKIKNIEKIVESLTK